MGKGDEGEGLYPGNALSNSDQQAGKNSDQLSVGSGYELRIRNCNLVTGH
jgi:hypothetical protein